MATNTCNLGRLDVNSSIVANNNELATVRIITGNINFRLIYKHYFIHFCSFPVRAQPTIIANFPNNEFSNYWQWRNHIYHSSPEPDFDLCRLKCFADLVQCNFFIHNGSHCQMGNFMASITPVVPIDVSGDMYFSRGE